MGARLVSPTGATHELTLEEYIELRIKLIEKLPTRIERFDALMELIRETKEEGDDEWWDDFMVFLNENRFTIPERDLGFDDE